MRPETKLGNHTKLIFPKVTVIYSEELNPIAWEDRHRRGEVPGRFAYGLDQLARTGFQVGVETVRPAGRDPRIWAGVLDPRLNKRLAQSRDENTFLAWEESTAIPMLYRHGRSQHRLTAGMIWATDAVSRGQSSVGLRLLRRTYRRMDGIWVLSRGQLPVLREWLGVPESRLHYVPFGIDTSYFAQMPMPTAPLVLSLGNDRDRDFGTLLDAMRIVRQKMPETRVVIQSRRLSHMPDGIEVIPRLSGPEVKAWYSQSSVVAIATKPNLHVSGMTTALEAMATGRPVVLSHTAGAEDYVRDRTTGRLVPPGVPRAMADAVLELLRDSGLRRQMGAMAAEHVRDCHTESHMAESLKAVIRP